jgi:hypothetical protein
MDLARKGTENKLCQDIIKQEPFFTSITTTKSGKD